MNKRPSIKVHAIKNFLPLNGNEFNFINYLILLMLNPHPHIRITTDRSIETVGEIEKLKLW